MSYQPFLQGPGRVNDNVKLGPIIYKITHVDDLFIPKIGWNAANATWQDSVFNALSAGADSGFRDLTFTNPQELRLLQLTGIEINSPFLQISLKQPAKMTRWGAGNEPEGKLLAFHSPQGSPCQIRELFSVQNKPVQLRAVNIAKAHPAIPNLFFRGFIYELDKGGSAPYFEPPIGGME